MIEVELKARVADPGRVEAAILAFAEPARNFEKEDAYWHGPGWRIHRGQKGFRIRRDGDEAVVTFKDKRSEGGIEINREREFTVSDPATFAEFAERMGCEPFFTKSKRGRSFEIRRAGARPLLLELCEVAGLGWFLEIVALVEEGDPAGVALARGEIRSLLAKAGLGESDIEPRYYSELLLAAGLRAPD